MSNSPSHSLPTENQENLEAWRKLSWRQSEDVTASHLATNPDFSSTPNKSRTPRKSPGKNRDERHTLWRENDATNKENEPLSLSPVKSPGLDPKRFHKKRFSDPKQEQLSEELEEKIQKSLLTQDKLRHKESLEAQRKTFRQVTTLKTWPLQDMAMEHLDHLLDGTHSQSQFHGGDYLSSESSSSTGSAAQGGKRRQKAGETCPPSLDCKLQVTSTLDPQATTPLWSKEPRIFATEKANGKRKYLVGHFGRIADWYWRKCVNKHLYEVITEKTPCRLYFDLEYSKKFNLHVNEEELMEEFREELAAEFNEHYQVVLNESHIIDLDSSTDTKFSRHWIIDLDGEGFFEDAPTVGRFVRRMVGRLAGEQATSQLETRRPTLAKYLFVKTEDAKKLACFIDLSVYTRNRLFRCLGSSKYGKPQPLQVSDSNAYPLPPLPEGTNKTDNVRTEEGYTPNNIQTTTLDEYIAANNWEPQASALAATLVIPLGGSNGKRIFRVQEDKLVIKTGGSITTSLQQSTRVFHPAISIHAAKSPFPSLENFVLEVLGCRGGTHGAIRAWSLEYGGARGDIPASVTYQMFRNRYCELIGRTHKSNNIFWTVIFDSWTCIQGCHDPDCFGRGAPVPIRKDYLLSIKEEFEAWRDEEFEKALLALNLDDLPANTAEKAPFTDNGDDSKKMAIMETNTVKHGEASKVVDQGLKDGENVSADSSCVLSDEALLAAISANPELFP